MSAAPVTGSPGSALESLRFRKAREATWRRLDLLIRKVDRGGLRGLRPAELAELPGLYRATLSGLSVARAISLDQNLLVWLESLAARAYVIVYGPKRSLGAAFATLLRTDFPRSVRRHGIAVLLSLAFVLTGTLTGFVLVRSDSAWYLALVDSEMAQGRTPDSSREELSERLYHDQAGAESLGAFATFLFTNNSRVGILSFTLGFLAGLPVFLLLFQNGLLLGAMSAIHHDKGLALDWWGWVLPHGVTELLALVLCGAAGLVLAQALLFPGRHTRRENLAIQGRDAARLVVGAVCMLFLAGLIEGFFRQLVHSVPVRYALIVGSAAAWGLYFALAGRPGSDR